MVSAVETKLYRRRESRHPALVMSRGNTLLHFV